MSNHMLLMSFDDSNLMNLNNSLNRFFEYTFYLLQKKTDVNFCFIGTAGNDRLIERLFFTLFLRAKYGNRVHTSRLNLSKSNLTTKELEQYITTQDIIFIGGGNTDRMLKIWENKQFTSVLNKLRDQGRLPILAGVSAGGMYPFHSGLTDSTLGHYKPLKCLGWFEHSFCAHSASKKKAICAHAHNQSLARLPAFCAAIKSGALPEGYAVPDDCMLHFYNGKFIKALTSRANNSCYFVTAQNINSLDTQHITMDNSYDVAHTSLLELGLDTARLEEKTLLFRAECGWLFFKLIAIYKMIVRRISLAF